MALSLILRNSAKFEGLRNVAAVARRAQFSQLARQPQRPLNLTDKCSKFTAIKPELNRGISLTAPRKSAHGNHATMWNVERALSLALLGIIPAGIITPCALFDNLMAVSLVAHSHWGLEACVIDYIRPIIFGAAIPKLAMGALYLASFLTLGGLLYFNYHDIGMGKAVRKFWSLKGK